MMAIMYLQCSTLALVILLMPLCAFAQAPARVGILVQEMGRAQAQAIKGLTEELKRLGYVNRKNLVFETANVKGNRGALPSAAAALTGQKLNLIFTTGTSATRAAAMATTEIPVVFVHPADPVAAGLFKSADNHAKNLTGVAAYAGETVGTRLALFKEILPGLRKIIVFFNANNPVGRENFERAASAAKKQNIAIAAYPIKSADELKTTIANLHAEIGAAIFQVADELVEGEADFLFENARAKKIPTMFNEESWVINGALAAYGPNYFEMGRKAGGLAAKIIGGERVVSLPVQRASKFDLTLNYRTSNFIGVHLSAELLKKADKIIR
jgi:ABC-type uncharacterized transport system substrate-binding protein